MAQVRRQKRPYFSKEARRTMLLDIACRLVEQQGWSALSMMSLADAAGVSRQLVYQHFRSTDRLIAAALAHFFRDLLERARKALAANADSLDHRTRAVEGMMFSLPRGRARALWQVVAASNAGSRPLARASRDLRQLASDLYAPFIESELPLEGEAARHVAWMLVMAFWGIFQIYDEGEIDAEDAIRLNLWLVQRFVHGAEAPSPPVIEVRTRGRSGVKRGRAAQELRSGRQQQGAAAN